MLRSKQRAIKGMFFTSFNNIVNQNCFYDFIVIEPPLLKLIEESDRNTAVIDAVKFNLDKGFKQALNTKLKMH